MKKTLFFLKNPVVKFLSIFILLLGLTFSGNAQSIQRQTIASVGSSNLSGNILIRQTIGQPYSTKGQTVDKKSYHPGFQQSSIFKIEKIKTNLKLEITIFPNPTVSTVNILCPEIIKNAKIKVVDASGKLIFFKQIEGFQSYQLNCDTWMNGIYFIKVSDSNNKSNLSKLLILK